MVSIKDRTFLNYRRRYKVHKNGVLYVVKVTRVDADCRFCFLSESALHCPSEQTLTRKQWKMSFADFKVVKFSCVQGVWPKIFLTS